MSIPATMAETVMCVCVRACMCVRVCAREQALSHV